MFTIHSIVGLGLGLYALVIIFKGSVTVSDGDSSVGGRSKSWTWLSRAEKPLQFWLFVLVILGLAAIFFFNVFNLPF
jgi:hypothetical protein